MSKIKHLTYIFAFIVQAIGLFGCAPDASDTRSGASAWTIGEQLFSPAEGETVPLKTAEELRLTLDLNDSLLFPTAEKLKSPNPRVHITTECVTAKLEKIHHEFSEPLQSRYKIFELLPAEALRQSLGDLDQPLQCRFEFLASNARGDTHHISIRQTVVTLSAPINPLRITKPFEGAPKENHNLLEIKKSELAQYMLPQLSDRNTYYSVACQFHTGVAKIYHAPISLGEMTWTNTTEIDEANRIEACQGLKLRNDGKILALTQNLILRPNFYGPTIERKRISAALSTLPGAPKNKIWAEYLISNPTDDDMIVELDPKDINLLMTGVFYAKSGKLGSIFIAETGIELTNSKLENISGRHRFLIAANQTVTLALYNNYKSIRCKNALLIGAFYRFGNLAGVRLNTLDSLDAIADDRIHILGSTLLDTSTERYWFAPPNVIPSPNQMTPPVTLLPIPKTAPKISRLEEGRCETL